MLFIYDYYGHFNHHPSSTENYQNRFEIILEL